MPSLTKADLERIVHGLPWQQWSADAEREMASDADDIVDDAGSVSAAEVGGDWDASDPFTTKHVSGYIGDEITGVTTYTRERLVNVLFDAVEGDGLPSMTELGGRMRDAVDGAYILSPDRALTIARTETATLLNIGQLAAYHQNGIENVDVTDGDDDEDCAEADGATWTIEEALDDPIAHPNCVRSFAPADPGEVAE